MIVCPVVYPFGIDTKKPFKGLKKKRKRKRRTTTTVVDSSDNVLNSCVIVCDDPNLHNTPEGKHHRYSKVHQGFMQDLPLENWFFFYNPYTWLYNVYCCHSV